MTSSLERRLAKLEPPPPPVQAKWRRIIAQPDDDSATTQRRAIELSDIEERLARLEAAGGQRT